MARMPYTNFHDINLDWIIKRVMKAFTPDNPPDYPVKSVNSKTGHVVLDSDDIQDLDSGLDLTDAMRKKQNRPESAGTAGQVLGLDQQLQPVWMNQPDPASIIDDNAGGGDTDKVYSADHVTGLISPIIDDIGDIKNTLSANFEFLNYEISDLPSVSYRNGFNTDGKYLTADGSIGSQNGWSITPYLMIGDETLYHFANGVTSNVVKNCYYDKDKNFISSFETGVYAGDFVLIPPSNARFVRFSVQTTDTANFAYTSTKKMIDVVRPLDVAESQKLSDIQALLIDGLYYKQDGTSGNSSSWASTNLVSVTSGDKVVVKNALEQYVTYFDSEKAFLSRERITTLQDVSITVPDGAAFAVFSAVKANLSGYDVLINGISLNAKYGIPWVSQSIWSGKTYISHGDSITWRDKQVWGSGNDVGWYARGYQSIFAENVGLAGYANHGKNGWPMAVVNGNGVVNTILAISDYSVYDLCTIACGTNDFKLNVPLGQLGIIGDTTFDDTTFYGAYRKAIEYILTKSPTIRLVLMTPLQRDNEGYDVNTVNTAGHKLIDYVNAIKAVGEMYGLPVCDMYANSGFTKKTLATYTLDGLHPNTTGYIRMGNYLTGYLNAVGN